MRACMQQNQPGRDAIRGRGEEKAARFNGCLSSLCSMYYSKTKRERERERRRKKGQNHLQSAVNDAETRRSESGNSCFAQGKKKKKKKQEKCTNIRSV